MQPLFLRIDSDSFGRDDFDIHWNRTVRRGFDLSGLDGWGEVLGLRYSRLNPGTYRSNSFDGRDVGGFTLVVSRTSVPEPSTLALAGLGLGLLGFTARRRRTK